jgi:hypothetical protein
MTASLAAPLFGATTLRFYFAHAQRPAVTA